MQAQNQPEIFWQTWGRTPPDAKSPAWLTTLQVSA